MSQTSPNPSPPYSTPETAAHTIQEGVDVANDGDTVLVAAAQYYLTNQVTVTKAIVLQSTAGADQTFLDNTNMTWTLWISNSLAVADGFTLQDPLLTTIKEPRGAFLAGGTIQNCNFTNFGLVQQGAIVSISGGTLSNSIALYNRRGPYAAVSCTNGVIIDCQVLGGGGGPLGTGVYLEDARLQNSLIQGVPSHNSSGPAVSANSSTVVGCTISNNISSGQGGGAYLNGSLMDRCFVTYNAGVWGAGVFETNSVIRDSLIVSNTAIIPQTDNGLGGHGGGVYMQGGAVVNCTVAANTAQSCPSDPGEAGGIYIESGGVTNSIIQYNTLSVCSTGTNNWFNSGAGIFDHCCTVPDPGGTGNITQDPQFVDMANGNYHLASSSPGIGAGVVQPWMTGAQDLDGNPRTTSGRVDMGAYENQYPVVPILSIARSGSNVVLRWPCGHFGPRARTIFGSRRAGKLDSQRGNCQ